MDWCLSFNSNVLLLIVVKSDCAPILSRFYSEKFLVCCSPCTLMIFWMMLNHKSDSCICYHEIKDTRTWQNISRIQSHSVAVEKKMGSKFQPVKCNLMRLTRKQIKKVHAAYTWERTVLEDVESIENLDITITQDLRWKEHVSNTCICRQIESLDSFNRNYWLAAKMWRKWQMYKALV